MNPSLGRRKQLVNVEASHLIDGSVQPRRIIMADGTCFDIDSFIDPRVITSQHAAPTKQYPITIRGQETYLYESNGMWWVLCKN